LLLLLPLPLLLVQAVVLGSLPAWEHSSPLLEEETGICIIFSLSTLASKLVDDTLLLSKRDESLQQVAVS